MNSQELKFNFWKSEFVITSPKRQRDYKERYQLQGPRSTPGFSSILGSESHMVCESNEELPHRLAQ